LPPFENRRSRAPLTVCVGVSASCVTWCGAGAMPVDAELYYGFTRFAIELNEVDESQRHLYAPTDTRFRPDQR